MNGNITNPFAQYMAGLNPQNVMTAFPGAQPQGPLPTPTPQQLQSQQTPPLPPPSIMQTQSGFNPLASLTRGTGPGGLTSGQNAITQPPGLASMLAGGSGAGGAAGAAGGGAGGGLAAGLSKMYPWLMALSFLQQGASTPSASFGGGRGGGFEV